MRLVNKGDHVYNCKNMRTVVNLSQDYIGFHDGTTIKQSSLLSGNYIIQSGGEFYTYNPSANIKRICEEFSIWEGGVKIINMHSKECKEIDLGEKEMKVYERKTLVYGEDVKEASVDMLKEMLSSIRKEMEDLQEISYAAPDYCDRESRKLDKAHDAVARELNRR